MHFKRLAAAFIVAAALLAPVAARSAGRNPPEAHFAIFNQSDASVWVTVDHHSEVNSCVLPHGSVAWDPDTIPAEVRAEFFKGACRRSPHLYEQAIPFPKAGGFAQFFATKDAGGYHFTARFK